MSEVTPYNLNGNVTRAQSEDGTMSVRYEYDAAIRCSRYAATILGRRSSKRSGGLRESQFRKAPFFQKVAEGLTGARSTSPANTEALAADIQEAADEMAQDINVEDIPV